MKLGNFLKAGQLSIGPTWRAAGVGRLVNLTQLPQPLT
jgi:hypothetical protein